MWVCLLWLLQGCPILFVSSLGLRHTVDHRDDVLIGDAIWELKERLAANNHVGLEAASVELIELVDGLEGQMVDLDTLTIRVGYKDLELAELLDQAFLIGMATLSTLVEMPAKWIPDQPKFVQLFRRPFYKWIEKPLAAAQVWAKVRKIRLEVADNPFEAWLELVAPLWLSELEARQVREEQLARHIESIKRTHANDAADSFTATMEHHFKEYNATSYIRSAEDELRAFRTNRPSVLMFSIDACDFEGQIPPATMEDLADLDEAPLEKGTILDMCMKASISVDLRGVNARLRWSANQLASIDKITVRGGAAVVRHATWDRYSVSPEIILSPEVPPCHVKRSFVPPTFYMDLDVQVEALRSNYVPGFEYTLEDMGVAIRKLFPPVFFLDPQQQANPLPWWDTLRRLVHGKVVISCYTTSISLLSPEKGSISHIKASQPEGAPSNLSVHEESATERLDVNISVLKVRYSDSSIEVLCWGVLMEQQPNPWTLPPLLEVPTVRLTIDLEWHYPGGKGDYRIYPIIKDEKARECEGELAPSSDWKFAESFRSQSVEIKVKVDIKTLSEEPQVIEKKMFESVPDWSRSAHVDRGVQQAVLCVKTPATAMVYGVSIPWGCSWAGSFVGFFSRVRVRRRAREILGQAMERFRRHISAVHILSVALDGLNLLVFDSHPLDDRRHGVRVAVTGQLAFSGSITEEETLQDPFQTGRVKLPGIAKPFWAIHKVRH